MVFIRFYSARSPSEGRRRAAYSAGKIVATKQNIVEGAKDVVDRAMTISGGSGMFKGNELERLYRDVRCGGFHPGNDALTHEVVGKSVLGILTEQPRW